MPTPPLSTERTLAAVAGRVNMILNQHPPPNSITGYRRHFYRTLSALIPYQPLGDVFGSGGLVRLFVYYLRDHPRYFVLWKF